MTVNRDRTAPDDDSSDNRVRCQGCGTRPDPATLTGWDGLPWTWSIGTDDQQRRTVLCPHCARQLARSIEARLDEDW